MATLATLNVLLKLDDQLSGALGGVSRNVQAFGKSIANVGKVATIGLTLPILGGFYKATQAASDLAEATSATETIFGKSAKSIEKWAQTTADAYGISNEAALTAVDTLGQLYKAVGISTDAAGKMGMQVVETAGDLASFYNVDPGTALADLQSGLVGEYEPLRKYGIVLSEATVQQRAMADTGKTNAKQLTESEKVIARQELITEQLGAAQGDAARTANGLANTMRRLKAIGIDVAASFGKLLLPYALKLASGLLKLLKALGNLSPGMKGLVVGIAAAVAAVGPILTVLGYLTVAFGALLSPLGLLAIGLVLIATKTDLLQRAFRFVADAIGPFVAALIEAFDSGTKISDLAGFLPKPLQRLEHGFLLVADAIGDLVAAWKSGGLSGLLDALPGELSQALDGVLSLVSGLGHIAVDFVLDTAVSVAGWLWDHKGDIWGGIKALVGWTTNTFTEAVTAAIDAGIELGGWLWEHRSNIWHGIKDAVGWTTNEFTELITATVDGGLELGEKLKGYAADFATWLETQIEGDWDGVIRLGGVILDATLTLSETIDFAGAASAIRDGVVSAVSDLTDLGSQIASAVADKITEIDWTTVVTADSFNVGAAYGGAIHDAIAAAVDIQVQAASALADALSTADYSAIPGKIADATIAEMKVGGAVFAGVGVAVASAIGGAIAGLVFGPDVSFDDVVTKIQTGVQTAIDASTGWADMLATQGGNLIIGLGNGSIDNWNTTVEPWFADLPQLVFDTIGDVTKTLNQKGIDLIQGMWDGALDQWTLFSQFLGQRGGVAYNAVGDISQSLRSRGVELIEGLWDGAGDQWDAVTNWLGGLGDDAAIWVGDLSGALYYSGVQLVNGIIDGINAAAGGIAQAIRNAIPSSITVFGVTIPVPSPLAAGGIVDSALQLVGERGPELAALPMGTRVFNHADTMGLLNGGRGSGDYHDNRTLVVNLNGYQKSPRELADEIGYIWDREMSLRGAS